MGQAEELDPVTIQVMNDAFISLRFVALSLEGEDAQGQALDGLVRANLAHGQLNSALREIERIQDGIWRARGLVHIADYLVEQDRIEDALLHLDQAVQSVDLSLPPRDEGEVLRVVAERQARLGELENAIGTAQLLPEGAKRVEALMDAARFSRDKVAPGVDWSTVAGGILEAAFQELASLSIDIWIGVDLYLQIGYAQLETRDIAAAVRTFTHLRKVLEASFYEGRNRALADLAGAFIIAGDQPQAMEVVRLIPREGERARGLATVARVLGEAGDLDAATPLFSLAFESTERIFESVERDDALKHILIEQSRVGRLADAFTTAGAIKDSIRQSEALLAMAEVLILQSKFDEALLLVEYIPYISLRSQIYAAVAEHRGLQGASAAASELLSKALAPTGAQPLPDYLPTALNRVLNAQLAVGDSDSDDGVFGRARELAELIPDELARVRALTKLAVGLARRGDRGAANRAISGAYRTAWLHSDADNFQDALADIVNGQLAAGDLLSAFDSAARIPFEPGLPIYPRDRKGDYTEPKIRSLTSVAAEAARQGETELALRAARQIEHPPARAAALANIAVAIATPEETLTKVQPIDTMQTLILDDTAPIIEPAPRLAPPGG